MPLTDEYAKAAQQQQDKAVTKSARQLVLEPELTMALHVENEGTTFAFCPVLVIRDHTYESTAQLLQQTKPYIYIPGLLSNSDSIHPQPSITCSTMQDAKALHVKAIAEVERWFGRHMLADTSHLTDAPMYRDAFHTMCRVLEWHLSSSSGTVGALNTPPSAKDFTIVARLASAIKVNHVSGSSIKIQVGLRLGIQEDTLRNDYEFFPKTVMRTHRYYKSNNPQTYPCSLFASACDLLEDTIMAQSNAQYVFGGKVDCSTLLFELPNSPDKSIFTTITSCHKQLLAITQAVIQWSQFGSEWKTVEVIPLNYG